MHKIYDNVKIGKNVIIEDFCIIGLPPSGKADGELETIIGDNSIIRSHTVIYAGNKIGNCFKTGHHTVIRENNYIGNDVSIGTYSEIAFNVNIGNNVKIHSDCHIYENTIIEDDVRMNPGVFILNTKYPYPKKAKSVLDGCKIRKGAVIAARSTIMPGVEIGSNTLIGANSLVLNNVAPYSIVYGNPASFKKDIRDIKDKDGNSLY